MKRNMTTTIFLSVSAATLFVGGVSTLDVAIKNPGSVGAPQLAACAGAAILLSLAQVAWTIFGTDLD